VEKREKKYLIVKGIAGLGNRLFTLTAAVEYAKKTNRTLLVLWDEGLFGQVNENVFYDYFSLKNIHFIENLNQIDKYENLSKCPELLGENPQIGIYDIYRFSSANLLTKIPARFCFNDKMRQVFGYFTDNFKVTNTLQNDWLTMLNLFNKNSFPLGSNLSLNNNADVLFYVDFRPEHDAKLFKKIIQPKPYIQTKIEELVNQFGLSKSTLGVHVRYSDKKPIHTLEFLIDKIKKLKFDFNQIFLATDNEKIYQLFKEEFKNVICINNTFVIDETKGLHMNGISKNAKGEEKREVLLESILDMWLLSKCEYLIYQKNSTFSTTSAYLHSDQEKVSSW